MPATLLRHTGGQIWRDNKVSPRRTRRQFVARKLSAKEPYAQSVFKRERFDLGLNVRPRVSPAFVNFACRFVRS
jgi:hypothetical protein